MRTSGLIFFLLSTAFVPNTLFAQTSCNSSGKKVLFKEIHNMNLQFKAINDNINYKISSLIANYKQNYCPKNCTQKNNFKVNVSSVPRYTKKNSCKNTNEKYTFKKQFKSKLTGNKLKDMNKASQFLTYWIGKTFVNPYVPFKKKYVSAEHKNLLHAACPPCSFYLYYNYKFKKNNIIDSNFLVKCGDRKILRIFDSNFEATFILTNHWKCQNKKSQSFHITKTLKTKSQ